MEINFPLETTPRTRYKKRRMHANRAQWGLVGRGAVRRWLALALACAALAGPISLAADQVFWETGALLADFFPRAARVTYEQVVLNPTDLAAVERATGQAVPRREWTIFLALDEAGSVMGYAVFDEEPGQHQPITFAVQLDPHGRVQRQELVVYREPFGDEIRSERFRAQFVGRGPGESFGDVATVTGATISSESMRVGVRRVVEVMAQVLRTRDLVAQLASN